MWLSDLWPFCDAPPGGIGRTLCVLFPLTHTLSSSSALALSLSHIYFACYTPCASFYGQRDVVAVPFPSTPPSPLFLYTFSAPCVALFNTLWQHLSSLLFGIVDPAQKTKQRKKIEVGKKESTNISLYIWLRISFLSFRFVSLRSVCCLHSSTIFMVALKTHKMCPWHLWCDNVT